MGCIQTDGYARPSEWEEVAVSQERDAELNRLADGGPWESAIWFDRSLIVVLLVGMLAIACWLLT